MHLVKGGPRASSRKSTADRECRAIVGTYLTCQSLDFGHMSFQQYIIGRNGSEYIYGSVLAITC